MRDRHNTEPNSGTKQHNKVEITKWKNNAAAALTLSFDDGYKETFKNCAHYLAKHKISTTWNIPTACVGDTYQGRDIVSWSDIYEMAQQLGMEIASHSVNHPDIYISPLESLLNVPAGFYHASSKLAYLQKIITRMARILTHNESIKDEAKSTKPDITYEVTASKSEIDTRVTSQVALSYAYPYGKYNRAYKDCVRSAGYISARSTLKGYNFYKTIDFFNLRCIQLYEDTTIEEADSWIHTAMAKEAWLIETYHLVAEDNRFSYRWFTPTAAFQQHVDHLSNLADNNRLWIDTQQNVAKYMKQRLSSTVTIIRQDPSRSILRLGSKPAQLPDQELTLKMEIPHQWHEIKVSQDGRPIAATKENNLTLFNVLPNNGDILIESAGYRCES